MSRAKRKELTDAEVRVMNEQLTSVVDNSRWEPQQGEWRAGEFEVRVFETDEPPDTVFRKRRVVVRGRVSGHVVEATGIMVIWNILRCLMRLNYLNTDASGGRHPLAPQRGDT